jgi:putative NADH-flavin reductase
MKIAVLGATGRTGSSLVRQLLQRGHEVAVLVRDPDGLDAEVTDRVMVVVGDSRERSAIDMLVAGADAVVSALGPTAKEASLHTETAGVLIGAMAGAGVARFVGVSGAGIDVTGDQKSLSAKVVSLLIRTLGGGVAQDKAAEHRVYAASGLDWTLVRPPRLTDGDATGRLEHDAHRSTRSTTMTRADLAAFLVEVVEQDLYVRQAPFVATAR